MDHARLQEKSGSLLDHLRVRDMVGSFDVFLKRSMKLHHRLIDRGKLSLDIVSHKRASHILSAAKLHSASIRVSGKMYDISEELGIVLSPTASHRRVAHVGTGENKSIAAMPF